MSNLWKKYSKDVAEFIMHQERVLGTKNNHEHIHTHWSLA